LKGIDRKVLGRYIVFLLLFFKKIVYEYDCKNPFGPGANYCWKCKAKIS